MKIVKTGSGTWLTGNFIRHCGQYHVVLPSAACRRKRTRYALPMIEEWLDETSSGDPTIQDISYDIHQNDFGSLRGDCSNQVPDEEFDVSHQNEVDSIGALEEGILNPLLGSDFGDDQKNEVDLKRTPTLPDEICENPLIIESTWESQSSLPDVLDHSDDSNSE